MNDYGFVGRSGIAQLVPQQTREQAAGHVAYAIKLRFRELCAIDGFEKARQAVAEIINDEAEGKRR